MSKAIDRKFLDETFASMFSNPTYREYLFYAHVLGQMTVKVTESISAPAAVAFVRDHFELYIHPEMFKDFPINQRIGVLKHEALHVINGHCGNRFNGLNHKIMNIAADCANNQMINRSDLPEGVIYPDVLEKMIKEETGNDVKIPLNLTAEEYYNLIMQNAPEMKDDSEGEGECPQCGGSGEQPSDGNQDSENQDSQNSEGSDGNQDSKEPSNGGKKPCDCCQGSGKKEVPAKKGQGGKFKPTEPDSHEHFGKGDVSEDFVKERTKNLLEKAKDATLMSNGSLPQEYAEMIALNSPKQSEIPWQKLFQNVSSNTKKDTRETYMRRSRRFSHRPEVKGKLPNRTFEWLAIADVSGSMPDESVKDCIEEMIYLCKKMNTSAKLIQVDTDPMPSQDITASLKKFERKACGGTIMFPAIEQAKNENLHYDAVIILTDGGLSNHDIEQFLQVKVPVVWVVTDDYNEELARFRQGKMKAARLNTKTK